jgi:hypothetical protein
MSFAHSRSPIATRGWIGLGDSGPARRLPGRLAGEIDKAIKDHDEAIRLDPKFAEAQRNRAIALRDKK